MRPVELRPVADDSTDLQGRFKINTHYQKVANKPNRIQHHHHHHIRLLTVVIRN